MNVGDPLDGVLDPLLARLVEVGDEGDRHRRVAAAGDVEHAQVGAELIHDLPVT